MGYSSHDVTWPVLEATSDALEMPIEELPLLADAVDIDALDALVTADKSSDVTVSFRYAGMCVYVCSKETVYILPPDAGPLTN